MLQLVQLANFLPRFAAYDPGLFAAKFIKMVKRFNSKTFVGGDQIPEGFVKDGLLILYIVRADLYTKLHKSETETVKNG